MNGEIAHSHNPSRGMSWALVFSFVGHGALVVAVLFLGVLVSPFQKTSEKIIIQLPRGVSLDVSPNNSPGKKPKGEERAYEVANAVAPTPAPRPAPAPTPAPTPAATPAATPSATPEAAPPDEKKIVIPDKTPAATPEPKKADVKKIVKATPPPETPKPAAPVKTATKTPAVTQKVVAPGAGTALAAAGTATTAKTIDEGPPSLPGVPTGPAVKGDPNGATQWGDPNAPINTSVVLPADYLAELLNGLRANFSVSNNLQGKCVVEFKIARDGTLRDIKVLTSSGFVGLDELALRAVRTTAHVRPYVEYTQVSEITVVVPFHFGADTSAAGN